jgi:polysaccharide biosynthesis transport protein
MNSPSNASLPFKPEDILFVTLRHKWKLLLSLILGLGLGAVLLYTSTPSYISTAKVMVRYVMETRTLGPVSGVRQIKDTDQGGASVLNAELEILTSQDLLQKVITNIGIVKIAGRENATNSAAAAANVMRGLTVKVPSRSDVVNLAFRHTNPEVAQQVLNQLIKAYLTKHNEVHRSTGSFDYLQQKTEEYRMTLAQTEDELRTMKSRAGIVSIENSRIEIPARISLLRRSVDETLAELAQEEALFNFYAAPAAAAAAEANAGGTNNAAVQPAEIASDVPANPPPARNSFNREHAARLSRQLNELRIKEAELLAKYLETSKPVQQLRNQMAEVQRLLDEAGPIDDSAFPAVQTVRTAVPERAFAQMSVNRIPALQAKLKELKKQLTNATEEAKQIEGIEDGIRRLERRRELEETQYKYFYTGLEQAKVDDSLDQSAINNISVVQHPSIPSRAKDERIMIIAGAAAPFILVLLWVMLTEIVVPRTFARSKDLEGAGKMPVLVSIPHYGVNGHSKLKRRPAKDQAIVGSGDDLLHGEIPPWDPNDPMLEYYEALRDRIVMSYDEDTHKPKIVGLTSCNRGAGVSRIATGLAASLSRDVERNVLLIALEKNKVSVSAFDKGRPASEVPQKTAIAEENSECLVQKNLYSLATTGRNLAGASIVQSFTDLMPKLKMSDYDYIIFDLPPITQTSGALRLSTQMERTVLVVEAEKTARDKVQRAQQLLGKSSLCAVFNKAKSYGPFKPGADF